MRITKIQLKTKVLLSVIVPLTFFINSMNAQNQELKEAEQPSSKVFDLFEENELEGSESESNKKGVGESSNELSSNSTVNTENDNSDLSTAEKLEALKQEVIAVNRDLFILEEDLLFPASTQVALYFSVDIGYFFALDNLKLKIDDKQVSHHLYTENDVKALYRGAIQKPYIGNLSTGSHELVAVVIGTGPHNREYRKAISFTFEKKTGAKAIEIQLRDDLGKLQPSLNIVEW